MSWSQMDKILMHIASLYLMSCMGYILYLTFTSLFVPCIVLSLSDNSSLVANVICLLKPTWNKVYLILSYRQTDKQTDGLTIHRAAWSQLKKLLMQLRTVWLSWPALGVVKKLGFMKKPLCTWNKINWNPTEMKYDEPLDQFWVFPESIDTLNNFGGYSLMTQLYQSQQITTLNITEKNHLLTDLMQISY